MTHDLTPLVAMIGSLDLSDPDMADLLVDQIKRIRRHPAPTRGPLACAIVGTLATLGVTADPAGILAIAGASGKEWQAFLVWYESGGARKTHADRQWAPFRQDQTLAVRPQIFEHVDDSPGARIGKPGDHREVVRVAHERAITRKAEAAPRRADHDAAIARKTSRRVESASGRMVRGVWVMK